MTIAFKTARVKIDSTNTTIQNEPRSVTFDKHVHAAGLALNGFNIQFDNGDRNLLRQMINIRESEVKITGPTVTFSVDFLLRDNADDNPFSGWVDVLVVADLV